MGRDARGFGYSTPNPGSMSSNSEYEQMMFGYRSQVPPQFHVQNENMFRHIQQSYQKQYLGERETPISIPESPAEKKTEN